MVVKEIVAEMMQWAFQIKCCELSHQYHCQRKHECRGKIRVYRTEIVTEPLIGRDEDQPVKYESHEIPEKYDDDKPSEEPDKISSPIRLSA
jgi:hypothetical protein